MGSIPEELSRAAERIEDDERVKISVREILAWFGAERRGSRIVSKVRQALREKELATLPDFQHQHIDAEVEILPRELAESDMEAQVSGDEGEEVERPDNAEDPAYRVGQIEAANRPPVNVCPDAPLQKATTLMMGRDFSQLPVMTGARSVKGMITWKSIAGRFCIGEDPEYVRECMEKAWEISSEASIFDAVAVVKKHMSVLIRAQDKTICGIVTASDLTEQFGERAEPFLLIGEIENHLRQLLEMEFTIDNLVTLIDEGEEDRTLEGVWDMTFGDYIRVLQNPDCWERVGLAIDRITFTEDLDRVRNIRNDIMHFNPDGMEGKALEFLRHFSAFLQQLRPYWEH